MDDAALIDAVLLHRTEQGLSLRQLGAVVGVSFSALAKIERGDSAPRLATRLALLLWMGADASAEQAQVSRSQPSLTARVETLESLVKTLVGTLEDMQGELHTLRFPLE